MSDISQDDLDAMRHTAAHVLAAASVRLRPETRLGVGPAIEDGFYHDIDVDVHYTEQDLPKLQKEMERIKKMNLSIAHREISKEEAKKLFAQDPYKLELIDEIEDLPLLAGERLLRGHGRVLRRKSEGSMHRTAAEAQG
jgi:threonyl-tRNA synthetase